MNTPLGRLNVPSLIQTFELFRRLAPKPEMKINAALVSEPSMKSAYFRKGPPVLVFVSVCTKFI